MDELKLTRDEPFQNPRPRQTYSDRYIETVAAQIMQKDPGIPEHKAFDEASRRCGFINYQDFADKKGVLEAVK